MTEKTVYSPTALSHFFVRVSLTAVPKEMGLGLLVFDTSVSEVQVTGNYTEE
jgi:hypothetical protein